MSGSTLGTLFCVTNFGESHGPAIGCVIDGCPPGMEISAEYIQHELDRRKPGTSRHVTQRRESDTVEILSGVYEGKTTGAPIALLIRNEDQRSKDYSNIAESFRPGGSASEFQSLPEAHSLVPLALLRPPSVPELRLALAWPESRSRLS